MARLALTPVAALADEAFMRFCVLLIVVLLSYGLAWLYALAQVPRDERKAFVSEHAPELGALLFYGVWGAFFIGGFIWLLVGACFYGRQLEVVPFVPFWLLAYLGICAWAIRRVLVPYSHQQQAPHSDLPSAYVPPAVQVPTPACLPPITRASVPTLISSSPPAFPSQQKWQPTTTRPIDTKLCPECGHALKIRSGQYGKFYGCSYFPSCRYTKAIKQARIQKRRRTSTGNT